MSKKQNPKKKEEIKHQESTSQIISDTPKSRYSDEELEEFRQIILKKLEKARYDLQLLTEVYTGYNENDISDTSPTFKLFEEGSNVLTKEENSQFAARQMKFIKALEAALVRIENKTYGICRVTGKLISKERLRVVPHATLSIEAKLQQKKDIFPPLPQSFMQQFGSNEFEE